jgi:hypothetical protein
MNEYSVSPPKIRPLYWEQLRQYPLENPILIAVDRLSLQTIQRYHGVCLYCPEPPDYYGLNFCYRREVWVLYARPAVFSQAMALAQRIQWQGAAHLIVLRVHHEYLRGPKL